jgi:hypothetical protein
MSLGGSATGDNSGGGSGGSIHVVAVNFSGHGKANHFMYDNVDKYCSVLMCLIFSGMYEDKKESILQNNTYT